MENIKLNFAHICENAFLTQDGKLCVIGDFDRVSIKRQNKESSLFFSFYVVTNFSVVSGKEYIQKISLVNTKDGESLYTTPEIKQTSTEGKIGMLLRMDIIFPGSGKYKVIVRLDDFEHELNLLVEEAA